MSDKDWATGYAKSVAVFLNGDAIGYPDQRGQPVVDDSFLLLFNAADTGLDFVMPGADYGERWEILIDTTKPLDVEQPSIKADTPAHVEGRAVLVLRRVV